MSEGYWEFIVIGWTLTFLFMFGVSVGEVISYPHKNYDEFIEKEPTKARELGYRFYGFSVATIIGFIVWIFFT